MMRKIVLLSLLISCISTSYAQQAFVATDRDSVQIGDKISLSIVVEHDNQDELIYPDSASFGKDFDFLGRQTFQQTGKDSIVYHLQFFGSEESRIPKLAIRQVIQGDTISTAVPEIPLIFVSALDSEDSPFRPMKPLYQIAMAIWPFVLLIAILAALSYFGYRYYKNRPELHIIPETPQPPPPPFVDPLKNLESDLLRIRSQYPDPSADYKAWFSLMGDALRQYFEDMYHIPALECTSRELMQHLAREVVDEKLTEHTRKVLMLADRVKFAKFDPQPADTEMASELAFQFVKRAKDIDAPRIEQRRLQHQAMISEQVKSAEASV